MRTGLKLAGLHLALVAMLLRALLPAGWMPQDAAKTGSPFVICTMSGPVHPAPAHQPDPDRAKAPCVFAAAAHLSPPLAAGALPLPALAAAPFLSIAPRDLAARDLSHRPNAARAPPILV
jgi:hypothetical protein